MEKGGGSGEDREGQGRLFSSGSLSLGICWVHDGDTEVSTYILYPMHVCAPQVSTCVCSWMLCVYRAGQQYWKWTDGPSFLQMNQGSCGGLLTFIWLLLFQTRIV